MKRLIIYTSKHGTTEKIANYLAEKLQADKANLIHDNELDLASYDQVIIGSSIYYKAIHAKVTGFIEDNLEELLTKEIALFLVCLMSEDSAADQFNLNYNEALLNHSKADGFFGGVLEVQELNPIEKVVTSFAFKDTTTFDQVYYDEVDKFIEALEEEK